jgi:glycosyltransferase involved in cell wall biosynthesis
LNILQLCSGEGLSGAAKSTLLLTRELANRGHRVWLGCRRDSWIGSQLGSDSVEAIWSDLHRWPPDELRRIAALARLRQIDVVNTHMSRAHVFGVLLRWLFGIPCVATAHCGKFQPHWMLNDYVVAVSEAMRRYHVRYNLVRPSRIETVYNFVDPRWTGQAAPADRARVRAEFGADDSCLLIATVGAITPRKGQLHLIRALPGILQAVPGTRLVLVGAEPSRSTYLERVKATAEELGVAGHVVWAGTRSDVERIFAAIDLLVHPALEEPLGRVLLEAMASGVPVVTSDVNGTGECIRHGVTGLLVPPAESGPLAEATISLLRDPAKRRQFGEAGRAEIRERFSPAALTERYEAVFLRVIAQRKAA